MPSCNERRCFTAASIAACLENDPGVVWLLGNRVTATGQPETRMNGVDPFCHEEPARSLASRRLLYCTRTSPNCHHPHNTRNPSSTLNSPTASCD